LPQEDCLRLCAVLWSTGLHSQRPTGRKQVQEPLKDSQLPCADVEAADEAVCVHSEVTKPEAKLKPQHSAPAGAAAPSEAPLPSYTSLPPLPFAGGPSTTEYDNERPEELQYAASRLSRPTSAQIATIIEGYHDDFLEMPIRDSTDGFQDVLLSEVSLEKRLCRCKNNATAENTAK
jgi:hypothetical protein